MPSSLPHAPDGIGLAVVDTQPADGGWRTAIAVPGDLHGPEGILQGGLSASLPAIAAAHLLEEHGLLPGLGAADITSVTARLRRPTPVNALLHVDVRPGEAGELVAEVRNGDEVTVRATVEVLGPAPVPLVGDLQDLAVAPLPAPEPNTSYPHCFVCGMANPRGLKIAPGPIEGAGIDIAAWVPDERVDDGHGHVHRVATSAVLDCPGVWAGVSRMPTQGPGELGVAILLSEYRMQWYDDPGLGSECRTVGLVDDLDDRALRVRTALFDQDAKLRAMASAVHVLAPGMPPTPVAATSLA